MIYPLTNKVASMVEATMRMHETSYDAKAAAQAPLNADRNQFYKISLRDASRTVCAAADEPEMAFLIETAVRAHWGGCESWAHDVITMTTPPDIILGYYPNISAGLRAMEADNDCPPGWFNKRLPKAMKYFKMSVVERSAKAAYTTTLKSLGLIEHALYEEMPAGEYLAQGDHEVVNQMIVDKPEFGSYHKFLEVMFGECEPEELGLKELRLI